ncbi:putative CAM kinase [Neospora caninum Liverpool]|uniref:CAM kinase, putative n=1 Tax=Neospora caninum (strain Liverpool) TaxID=572307 RepID=F0VH52_NEOCL|nr:putative CAM kinase [Neospora caninum Liverpool]CBZ53046.1 putative CAM kinase [Neospora caninum Liverpool]CEL67030.1 TPA: CAM kinase, putative [Neospora caninum Liverpool]|eukprot:XP_003883078.1 putative CAM kinase [Neospora caninum Liverpool]
MASEATAEQEEGGREGRSGGFSADAEACEAAERGETESGEEACEEAWRARQAITAGRIFRSSRSGAVYQIDRVLGTGSAATVYLCRRIARGGGDAKGETGAEAFCGETDRGRAEGQGLVSAETLGDAQRMRESAAELRSTVCGDGERGCSAPARDGEERATQRRESTNVFAVKVIDLRAIKLCSDFAREIQKIHREVRILQQLHHPCVANLEDVVEEDDVLFLVMEYVKGGELFYRVVEKGCFSEPQACYIMHQLVHACMYMHKKHILHRDLKPENILVHRVLDGDFFVVKVADFGLAKLLTETSLAHTLVGTPQYWAPEVLQCSAGAAGTPPRRQHYGAAADLWSLGVCLYVMLGGSYPFDERIAPIQTVILRGQFHFRHPRFQRVSESAKDLVRRLLTVDTSRRITEQEVLEHPWMLRWMNPVDVRRFLPPGTSLANSPFHVMPPLPSLRAPSATSERSPAAADDGRKGKGEGEAGREDEGPDAGDGKESAGATAVGPFSDSPRRAPATELRVDGTARSELSSLGGSAAGVSEASRPLSASAPARDRGAGSARDRRRASSPSSEDAQGVGVPGSTRSGVHSRQRSTEPRAGGPELDASFLSSAVTSSPRACTDSSPLNAVSSPNSPVPVPALRAPPRSASGSRGAAGSPRFLLPPFELSLLLPLQLHALLLLHLLRLALRPAPALHALLERLLHALWRLQAQVRKCVEFVDCTSASALELLEDVAALYADAQPRAALLDGAAGDACSPREREKRRKQISVEAEPGGGLYNGGSEEEAWTRRDDDGAERRAKSEAMEELFACVGIWVGDMRRQGDACGRRYAAVEMQVRQLIDDLAALKRREETALCSLAASAEATHLSGRSRPAREEQPSTGAGRRAEGRGDAQGVVSSRVAGDSSYGSFSGRARFEATRSHPESGAADLGDGAEPARVEVVSEDGEAREDSATASQDVNEPARTPERGTSRRTRGVEGESEAESSVAAGDGETRQERARQDSPREAWIGWGRSPPRFPEGEGEAVSAWPQRGDTRKDAGVYLHRMDLLRKHLERQLKTLVENSFLDDTDLASAPTASVQIARPRGTEAEARRGERDSGRSGRAAHAAASSPGAGWHFGCPGDASALTDEILDFLFLSSDVATMHAKLVSSQQNELRLAAPAQSLEGPCPTGRRVPDSETWRAAQKARPSAVCVSEEDGAGSRGKAARGTPEFDGEFLGERDAEDGACLERKTDRMLREDGKDESDGEARSTVWGQNLNLSSLASPSFSGNAAQLWQLFASLRDGSADKGSCEAFGGGLFNPLPPVAFAKRDNTRGGEARNPSTRESTEARVTSFSSDSDRATTHSVPDGRDTPNENSAEATVESLSPPQALTPHSVSSSSPPTSFPASLPSAPASPSREPSASASGAAPRLARLPSSAGVSFEEQMFVLKLLTKSLDRLRRVDYLLSCICSFWDSFDVALTRLLQLQQLPKTLLGVRQANFQRRARERLRLYMEAWDKLRAQCRVYVHLAKRREEKLAEFGLQIQSTADQVDAIRALS